ncbi:ABC transporter ATP-binding protein [Maridesulfovibrio zosterae]|uniref:ABC transporter ATP-binding protein n=1 Tax=Maridesulfovibrio zosterae TaxID=82171 RepID=UPI0004882E73|nr:dipeptide/oligopeptide/nickel ABC transporter ATP-binding protein [Maridesulfovibrio zosterae]
MLLNVQNVTKSFPVGEDLFSKQRQQILKGVTFSMEKGECLGIVGESGSGKSTLGRIILGLEDADSGTVTFSPEVTASPLAKSVVFQDYTTSVNPRMLIKQAIAEPLLRSAMKKTALKKRIVELLNEVGLGTDLAERYPHQLSGGQLQRVCIARAIAPNPAFILFDEAVSSLDVSVQAQVLMLMRTLKEKHNIAFMFITHDITVATYVCDKLIFLNKGIVAEHINDMKKLNYAKNEYAKDLLQAAHFLEKPFTRRIQNEQ